MEAYGIVDELRNLSNSKGWAFLYGESYFQEYEAHKNSYTSGMLILGCDPFVVTPEYAPNGTKLISLKYQSMVALGRKREQATKSSLDETNIQKHDRRLKELMETLSTNLIQFACDNELTLQGVQFEQKLNQYSANLDFVVGSLTFYQEL